jgi:MSHA pilin protein MshD
MKRAQPTKRPAFGTPEVLMALAITGILIVAALQSVSMIYRTRTAMIDRLTGPGLARELMAEIMSMPYDDPDGAGLLGLDLSELLGNRSTYDDVDDYNGYSANNAENKSGVALTGYTGWRQQTAVAWVTLADPTATSGSETGVKRITVTITSPGGDQTQLVAYRSRYGALEQNQPIANRVISQLDAELRTGASTRSQRTAAAITNPALDPN